MECPDSVEGFDVGALESAVVRVHTIARYDVTNFVSFLLFEEFPADYFVVRDDDAGPM